MLVSATTWNILEHTSTKYNQKDKRLEVFNGRQLSLDTRLGIPRPLLLLNTPSSCGPNVR